MGEASSVPDMDRGSHGSPAADAPPDERTSPVRPEPAEGDPEHPVARSESGTPLSPQVDSELLPEGGVLEGQRGLGHPRSPEESEQS